jgi:hypothetical protein
LQDRLNLLGSIEEHQRIVSQRPPDPLGSLHYWEQVVCESVGDKDVIGGGSKYMPVAFRGISAGSMTIDAIHGTKSTLI